MKRYFVILHTSDGGKVTHKYYGFNNLLSRWLCSAYLFLTFKQGKQWVTKAEVNIR